MGKNLKEVVIYTDGSCLGNPGPGGYGAILMYTDSKGEVHKKELSDKAKETTNNRMELMAAIASLQELKFPCKVTLYSDSQYLCRAYNENWIYGWIKKGFKDVKNPDLWKRLIELTSIHEMTFVWVKGHAENEYNELCDKLARNMAKEAMCELEKELTGEGVD